ncbi:MAG: aminoacyl-tRNA hydrolase [Actinomycetota bacterium]
MEDAWLVAGLGNPGAEFERNRHNIGFRILDELAHRASSKFKRGKHSSQLAEAKADEARLILVKPQTFMNESGRSVAPLAKYYKVPLERVIVVHDEIDLPFGELRAKIGGGAAGHNGIRSITQSFSSPEFIRLRCGVGRPVGSRQAAGHVLANFSKKEEGELPSLIDAAADAVLLIVHEGVERAQNKINTHA